MIRAVARFGLALFLLLAPASRARADSSSWTYLIDKLVADGFERRRIVAVFDDDRIEPFTGLEFGADRPRESRALYGGFLRASSIAAARRCRLEHAAAFDRAEKNYGVSADAVAAILFVESGCGRNTGSSRVLYRLARLAMANDPENMRRNAERFCDDSGNLDPATAAKLRARGLYLEETFYPEVRAVFEVARRTGMDPLEIRGSPSGAFGYPQFLPTSYLSYGVDADGDGRVSLYEVDDAAASCARYLAAFGWHPGATRIERRGAVWQYNHSDAYIDSVLRLAERVGQPAPRQPPRARKPGKRAKSHKPANPGKHKPTPGHG